MRKLFTFIILFLFLGVSSYGVLNKERVFYLEERILLKNLPENSSNLNIWIPYPVSDNWQEISDFSLIGAFNSDVITDSEYGNRILYIETQSREVILSYKVTRREYCECCGIAKDEIMARFLESDRLVPVNGEIRRLAKGIAKGKQSDLEKARAIYDYVIDTLTYSKDDPNVCGVGDSLLTLQHKKGICTDYHSLFISLVRSLGIPAKFEIGYRIPEEGEGKINGYHCWAKFYIKDKGWIPVDISEADKCPEKKEYFFGHIDENRVQLTTGRDIRLEYAKDSQPLNFFVYPYAELNGKRFNDIEIELAFKELKR